MTNKRERELVTKINIAANKITQTYGCGNYMIVGSQFAEELQVSIDNGEKHRKRKLKMEKLLKEIKK